MSGLDTVLAADRPLPLAELPPAEAGAAGAWELGRVLEPGHDVAGGARRRFLCAMPAPDGSVAIVDELCDTVFVLDDRGLRTLPGSGLARPSFAVFAAQGLYVVDAGRGEVVCLAADGTAAWRRAYPDAERGAVPGALAVAPDGTVYLAFPALGRVLGIDRAGRVVRRHAAAPGGAPAGVSVCPDGTLLIADSAAHVVERRDAEDRVLWHYGERGYPGSGPGLLNTPAFVAPTPGGVLISDTKNNRVLEADHDGRVRWSYGGSFGCGAAPGLLRMPRTAVRLSDGATLVAEWLGGRVLKVCADQSVEVLCGSAQVHSAELALPRGGSFATDGAVRVTDCYNDRVLLLGRDGAVRWKLDRVRGAVGPETLWWPRFWTGEPDDALIADGRNRRVLRVGRAGAVRGELTGFAPPGDGPREDFVDPHHVQRLAGERILVSDAGADVVVELDWTGRAHWLQRGLSDPHQATRLPDGATLIADTGNDRVIEVLPDGRTGWSYTAEDARRTTGEPLRRPRSAQRTARGGTLVVDTGNHRLIEVDRAGALLRSYRPPGRTGPGCLESPRYAELDPVEDLLLISDFENHRLLFTRLGA